MLAYPQIDPVAVSLGPLQIHWYGLMYLIGIGGAWWLASRRVQRFAPEWNKDKLSDLVFWVAMGVIRSEEHTSELQSRENLVCRLLLEKNNAMLFYSSHI